MERPEAPVPNRPAPFLMNTPEPRDDSYGTRKRLRFIEEAIGMVRPRQILDLGCGVGLVSLALADRHPDVRITAMDSDWASIMHARSSEHPANVVFIHSDDLDDDHRFELIIASEVLEHVENPDAFVRWIGRRLSENGRVILTVPNGYGPYEIMSLIEGLLRLSRLYALLRSVKRMLAKPPVSTAEVPITLAVSPHVNFFSYRGLNRLLIRAGFTVQRFQSRTFLCGFMLDNLLHGERSIAWNAAVADKLPASLSSDWMFLLQRGSPDMNVTPWANGLWGRLHRYVNRRCLGLSQQA